LEDPGVPLPEILRKAAGHAGEGFNSPS